MSGRQCTICYHQDRREIDEALLVGESTRKVAERFDVPKSTVARHRKDCLAPKIAAAARVVAPSPEPRREVERAKAIAAGTLLPAAEDILSLTALLERLSRSLERLDLAADKTVTDEQPMALAALSGQLHRGIEAAARLSGVGDLGPEKPSFGIQIIIPERAAASAAEREPPPYRDAGVSSSPMSAPGSPVRLTFDLSGSRK